MIIQGNVLDSYFAKQQIVKPKNYHKSYLGAFISGKGQKKKSCMSTSTRVYAEKHKCDYKDKKSYDSSAFACIFKKEDGLLNWHFFPVGSGKRS